MKEKAQNIGCFIIAIIIALIWLVMIFSMNNTDRPDFATSPDEAIRTK